MKKDSQDVDPNLFVKGISSTEYQTLKSTYTAKTGMSEYDKPEIYNEKKQTEIPRQYRDTSLFIAFAPVEDPQIEYADISHGHQYPRKGYH